MNDADLKRVKGYLGLEVPIELAAFWDGLNLVEAVR